MNIHYIQHVPFEGLGILEDWVYQPAHQVTKTKVFEDNRFPFVDLFDVLIVLGGPMSVHDTAEHPWLEAEKNLIKKAIEKNKKVFGICLGAQLIAEVLGAQVKKNEFREIGWFPIENLDPTNPLMENIPSSFDAFHWHGETFDLPVGAKHLFSSKACKNQAFQYNQNVLAFQFHLEMNEVAIADLTVKAHSDLIEGPYVQSEMELINDVNLVIAQQYFWSMFHRFIQL
jgi:GMP synthase-like glutamine amidotransferase